MLDELKEFVRNIFSVIYVFLGSSIFFFAFGLKKISIHGSGYFLPFPSENSFSVQIFNHVKRHLLPQSVQLIVTSPLSAFIVQTELALLLGFILTFPFLIYKIIRYISPALFPKER